jgi:hypothetical protein
MRTSYTGYRTAYVGFHNHVYGPNDGAGINLSPPISRRWA